MADVRFKISGDSNGFVAQLYDYNCTTLISSKSIDYSGITNVFDTLYPNTCYKLNVIDSIGNTGVTSFCTPVQVGTTTLATKTIALLGTVASSFVNEKHINSPKCICVSPPLSNGECVDLKFRIITCNICNTSNSITLYCNNAPLSPTYLNTNSTIFKTINMKYSDTICYSMSISTDGITPFCGFSSLNLLCSATGYSFNPIVAPLLYCIGFAQPATTTTTTTTLQPVSVFIKDCLELSSNKYILSCVCAKIGTSRALVSGESFRLCYTDCALSSTITTPSATISASGFTCMSTTKCNLACSCVNGLTNGSDNESKYCYININSSNINTITLYAIAKSHTINRTKIYDNCASVYLNAISNSVGANFQLGSLSSRTITAINCCNCCNCPLPI